MTHRHLPLEAFLVLSLAFMALGCGGASTPKRRCANEGCGVEGRWYYRYRQADPALVNQTLTLKVKANGKELGRTQSGDLGYFRLNNLKEVDLFTGVDDELGPPAIIVCDGAGNCFDYGPLDPMGCTMDSIPEAPDPPLNACMTVLVDPANGTATAATIFDTVGLIRFGEQYGVVGVTTAAPGFSGDFSLVQTTGTPSPLAKASILLVQAGMKRAAARAQLVIGTSGDACGEQKACFTFPSVPPGKYVVQLTSGTAAVPLAGNVTAVGLKSVARTGNISLQAPRVGSPADGVVVEVIALP